jgi:cytochrome b subunit of formate dehydrogenase
MTMVGQIMKQGTYRVVTDARKTDVYLKRIAQASAWLLLVSLIVLLISGWGITRTEIIYKASLHLIDRGTANSIHRTVQVPTAFFFVLHLLINVRLKLPSRWLQKAWLFNSMLVALGVALLSGVVYMEYYA